MPGIIQRSRWYFRVFEKSYLVLLWFRLRLFHDIRFLPFNRMQIHILRRFTVLLHLVWFCMFWRRLSSLLLSVMGTNVICLLHISLLGNRFYDQPFFIIYSNVVQNVFHNEALIRFMADLKHVYICDLQDRSIKTPGSGSHGLAPSV